MRKLILLITIIMLGIWGISNADFSKTYPKHGGTGSGDVTTAALSDSLDSLRANGYFGNLYANYFESLMAIHWDAVTKKAAFDSTSSDSLEGYSHTLVSLPSDYATFWTVRSIAAADSDTCRISESDFPVTVNPDSARIWIKPSSTTEISARAIMINADGDTVGNHLIILTSTDWTEYEFAFRTGVITRDEKITTYIELIMGYGQEVNLGNLEVW